MHLNMPAHVADKSININSFGLPFDSEQSHFLSAVRAHDWKVFDIDRIIVITRPNTIHLSKITTTGTAAPGAASSKCADVATISRTQETFRILSLVYRCINGFGPVPEQPLRWLVRLHA